MYLITVQWHFKQPACIVITTKWAAEFGIAWSYRKVEQIVTDSGRLIAGGCVEGEEGLALGKNAYARLWDQCFGDEKGGVGHA